jgi:hypothetical protein
MNEPHAAPTCAALIAQIQAGNRIAAFLLARNTDALLVAFMYRRLVVNIGDAPLAGAPALRRQPAQRQ